MKGLILDVEQPEHNHLYIFMSVHRRRVVVALFLLAIWNIWLCLFAMKMAHIFHTLTTSIACQRSFASSQLQMLTPPTKRLAVRKKIIRKNDIEPFHRFLFWVYSTLDAECTAFYGGGDNDGHTKAIEKHFYALLCVGSSFDKSIVHRKPHKANILSSIETLSVPFCHYQCIFIFFDVAFSLFLSHCLCHRRHALSIFADSGRLRSRLHSYGRHAIEWNQSRFGHCIPREHRQWATAQIRRWCKWYLAAAYWDGWMKAICIFVSHSHSLLTDHQNKANRMLRFTWHMWPSQRLPKPSSHHSQPITSSNSIPAMRIH